MIVTKKQSMPSFPKNENLFLTDTHTHVCMSRGKKCQFFGKFGLLCFLGTPVLRFLPYYHLFVVAAIQKELSGYKLKKVLKTKGLKNDFSSEQF